MRRRATAVVLALCAALSSLAGGRAATGEPCDFRDTELRWIQRAFDGWELVRHEHLKLEPAPLPWIVLFDASCIWHIEARDPLVVAGATVVTADLAFAGRRLDIRALQHGGTVLLPSRVEIPAAVRASSALYDNGRASFLAMSMPALWRADRAHARNPHLEDYLQGVFTHELTHTRNLVSINRRLRGLTGSGDVPARVNDDIIQTRFQKEPGFVRAMEVERDMYFRAAADPDPVKRQHLAGAALTLRRARHARYFAGPSSVYGEIETLFLTLEGTGQWAAFRLGMTRGLLGGRTADVLKLVRDNRRFWSQDVGLGVFLLVDALVPGWQGAIFGRDPTSPFDLLQQAVEGSPRAAEGRAGSTDREETALP